MCADGLRHHPSICGIGQGHAQNGGNRGCDVRDRGAPHDLPFHHMLTEENDRHLGVVVPRRPVLGANTAIAVFRLKIAGVQGVAT